MFSMLWARDRIQTLGWSSEKCKKMLSVHDLSVLTVIVIIYNWIWYTHYSSIITWLYFTLSCSVSSNRKKNLLFVCLLRNDSPNTSINSSCPTTTVQKKARVTGLKQSNIVTCPFSRMFFKRGRCDWLRSLRDLIPLAWQIATRYIFSICFWFHFKSGNKTKPVTGSLSSNTTRSTSAFFSKMLYTHWNKDKNIWSIKLKNVAVFL